METIVYHSIIYAHPLTRFLVSFTIYMSPTHSFHINIFSIFFIHRPTLVGISIYIRIMINRRKKSFHFYKRKEKRKQKATPWITIKKVHLILWQWHMGSISSAQTENNEQTKSTGVRGV